MTFSNNDYSNHMMNVKKNILKLICLIFGLTACDNKLSKQNNTENKIEKVDTSAKMDISSSTNMDTIVYDYSSFPSDTCFSTKVLTVGTFHGDEVWDNVDKVNWLGLFHNTSGFYIAETKLQTKRVHDQIVDQKDNEKTGWEIQTINKDTSLILIEGINLLTAHNIEEAILSKKQIFPGDTLKINYLNIDYKIFATGGKKEIQGNPEQFEIWNYKLYLMATIEGLERKSLLVAQPNFDDQMINLIFAGDIDGDGILDLIIDTSRHYNATSPTLYLSKPATIKEVVKPIGGHISVGC